MLRKLLVIHLIAAFFISAFFAPSSPAGAATPTSTFGYTVSKTTTGANWKEISTTGTLVSLPLLDDGFSAPIAIPFPFRFFEKTTTAYAVCANGFISFEANFQNCTISNEHIPFDFAPNNIIAAFWDDLVLKSGYNDGDIYYKNFDVSGNDYVVIQWNRVSRFGSIDLLTFQIVLYDNGNIEINYKQINGDVSLSTIGIEDSDGVDGIEAYFKNTGFASPLVADLSLVFTYPSGNYHAKVVPTYQSDFITQKVNAQSAEFIFKVVNAGSVQDSFSLAAYPDAGNAWTVTFHDPVTKIQISNIGPIAAGDYRQVMARMTVPSSSSATVGMYSKARVEIKSTGNTDKTANLYIQGAIPSSFIQMFSDVEKRINLDTVTQSIHFERLASESYDHARSLAVAQIDPDDFWYLSVWEQLNLNDSTSIQYIRTNPLQNLPPATHQLTNNAAASQKTLDKAPAIEVNASRTAGVVFIRELNSGGFNIYNVYFGQINEGGGVLTAPENLTQNTLYYDGTTPNIPRFENPTIAAIGDRFITAWGRHQASLPKTLKNIQVRGFEGSTPKITTITNSTSSIEFFDPSICTYNSTTIFLTYFSFEADAPINKYKLNLVLLDENGNVKSGPFIVDATQGESLDMVKVGDHMFLAWTDTSLKRIRYVFVNASGSNVTPPSTLVSPDGRDMSKVSVTYNYPRTNPNPAALLTWENPQNDRLYYAMLNALVMVTPPMIYRQAQGALPVVHSGAAGYSIAPLPFPLRWETNLPVIRK